MRQSHGIFLIRLTLRTIATIGLATYGYGELAAHVYPFVLLPHLGLPLRVIALTLFAVLHAGMNFGWRVGLLMVFATTLVTWLFEQVGVATGAVYGAYHYSGMLGPKLGAVPMLIPLAWFMMIYTCDLVTSLIVDGQPFPNDTEFKGIGIRAVVAAMVMTAWDAVIDPGMSRAGFWIWEQGGSYFGVPRHNFAGWLVTTFSVYIVFGLFQRWLRPALVGPVRDWFTFLPTLVYAIVTIVQVANQEVTPSSVIAFFAMGLPALLACVRWTMSSDAHGAAQPRSKSSNWEPGASRWNLGIEQPETRR